jgi:hypothetical protein
VVVGVAGGEQVERNAPDHHDLDREGAPTRAAAANQLGPSASDHSGCIVGRRDGLDVLERESFVLLELGGDIREPLAWEHAVVQGEGRAGVCTRVVVPVVKDVQLQLVPDVIDFDREIAPLLSAGAVEAGR